MKNLKVKLQCSLFESILTLNWWKVSFTISQYLIFINVIVIYFKMTFDEIVDILHIQYLHDKLFSSTTQRIWDNLNIWNLFHTKNSSFHIFKCHDDFYFCQYFEKEDLLRFVDISFHCHSKKVSSKRLLLSYSEVRKFNNEYITLCPIAQ